MSRTKNLKKTITAELKKAIEQVNYEIAPNPIAYPYAVYSLEHRRNEIGFAYFLEVNIFDKSPNIENIADSMEELLDDTNLTTEDCSIRIDLNSRNTIFENDKSIKRRRLLFDLEYFGKE